MPQTEQPEKLSQGRAEVEAQQCASGQCIERTSPGYLGQGGEPSKKRFSVIRRSRVSSNIAVVTTIPFTKWANFHEAPHDKMDAHLY